MGLFSSKKREFRSYSADDINFLKKLDENELNIKVAERIRVFEKLRAARKTENASKFQSLRRGKAVGRNQIKKTFISQPVDILCDSSYSLFIEEFLGGKLDMNKENQEKLPLYMCDECGGKIPDMIDFLTEKEQPRVDKCKYTTLLNCII